VFHWRYLSLDFILSTLVQFLDTDKRVLPSPDCVRGVRGSFLTSFLFPSGRARAVLAFLLPDEAFFGTPQYGSLLFWTVYNYRPELDWRRSPFFIPSPPLVQRLMTRSSNPLVASRNRPLVSISTTPSSLSPLQVRSSFTKPFFFLPNLQMD